MNVSANPAIHHQMAAATGAKNIVAQPEIQKILSQPAGTPAPAPHSLSSGSSGASRTGSLLDVKV